MLRDAATARGARQDPNTIVDAMRHSRATVALGAVLAAISTAAPTLAAQEPRAVVPAVDAQQAIAETRRHPSPAALETITLDDVLALARERNPRLQAARSRAEAFAARQSWAGVLPDPSLELGIMNFSVPGFDTDMPNSMAPAIGVSQKIPFPGKLGLDSRIAQRATDMAVADREETWWRVRARASAAFYQLYAVDRRLEVMRRTKQLLEDFRAAAQAMYGAGEGRQTDVLQANVELARMDADIASMEAMRRVIEAKLNAVLDRPAATPIPTPELPTLPAGTPGADALLAWADAEQPALERERAGVARAEAAVARAKRDIWPDLMLGAQYGQRSLGGETQRMGSVMLGFSLPVFAGSRQLEYREEARAMERMARAELAEMRAEVDAEIGEHLAEMERQRTLIRLFRDEVLPQARTAVESAFSSYRVGAVDFMTLVDAQMTVNRYEGELHALLADYGTHVAELEAATGRELPAGPGLEVEVR